MSQKKRVPSTGYSMMESLVDADVGIGYPIASVVDVSISIESGIG
jgi:hypothetical protein